MQTTVEGTAKHTVRLQVEIPPEEFARDLDRAYRKVAGEVKIPGFRKGKVPKRIIDAKGQIHHLGGEGHEVHGQRRSVGHRLHPAHEALRQSEVEQARGTGVQPVRRDPEVPTDPVATTAS